MIEKKTRRQLYEHLCARLRAEVDAEETRKLILETQTADRGYWVVIDQVQSLLPESGVPQQVPPEGLRMLARCLIYLWSTEDYQWEQQSQMPSSKPVMVALVVALLIGMAAVATVVLVAQPWVLWLFYAMLATALLVLLSAYAMYRRKLQTPQGDMAVWPFFDRPQYDAMRDALGPKFQADTGGLLTADMTEVTTDDGEKAGDAEKGKISGDGEADNGEAEAGNSGA